MDVVNKIGKLLEAKSAHDKSSSTLINKIGNSLKRFLPYVYYENKQFRLGLGVLAGDKKSEYGDNPITTPGFKDATGIALYIDIDEKVATVYEITTASPGMGTKMIETVLHILPKEYKISIHHDWSGGWWDKIMQKYSDREWVVN